jgi:lipoprotein-anchoring transpeptidase ErfK/SrfK
LSRLNLGGRSKRQVGGRIAVASLALVLAGCANPEPLNKNVDPAIREMYSSVDEKPYHIPTVNLAKIEPQFYRQEVPTPTTIKEPAGTIVVDPKDRFLYLVEADGQSIRYGIGVGREGFAWSGTAVVHDKAAWPKWFPPPEMVARDPKAAPYADGMAGGIKNPIGARALYLWQGNKDTLFRLHGTNEPSSIGHAVSSGCIRLLNQDVIDLYNRVPLGTKVVVLPTPDQNAQTIDFQDHPVGEGKSL